jgi:cyclin-dependent kinase 8/11
MAIFYAPIRLGLGEDESSDSDSSSASSKDQHPPVSVRDTPGYTIPVGISSIPLNAMWKRDALFDATRGEIALLWSIFRMMGTPTQDSWPVRASNLG